MGKKTKTTRDRISALPQSIIHHILSFLPNQDVKIASSLSKEWHHNSKSFPYLDFDEAWYHFSGDGMPLSSSYFDYDDQDDQYFECGEQEEEDNGLVLEPSDHLDKYANYVGETLRRFNDHNELHFRVTRLSIPIIYFPRIISPLLDSWISLVLQHPVEEFNLNLRYPSTDDKYIVWPFYDLPPSVFASKSIKVVKLCVCSLLRSFPSNYNHHLSGLTELSLCSVVLNDVILGSIIATCPVIKELSIIRCRGIQCLRISHLNKLKTLRISQSFVERMPEMVEIDVPSLQSLQIKEVKIRVLECPQLKHLDLDCMALEDLQLQDILSRLYFLRSLSLVNLFFLSKGKISSDTLNKLRVVDCPKLVELEIDAPNLLSVEYEGKFTPLASLGHNVMAGRWHVSTRYHGHLGNTFKVHDFLVGLRDFGSKVEHFEYLSLDLLLHFDQPSNFKEELHERAVLQPAINIDHLDIGVSTTGWNISYPYLLDRLLWSCHPHTLSLKLHTFPSYLNKNNIVMSIRDVVMHHRRHCNLPCKLARNWFHCLEDLMYVEDGSEDRLLMDGTSSICHRRRSACAIKFIFRW